MSIWSAVPAGAFLIQTVINSLKTAGIRQNAGAVCKMISAHADHIKP